MQKWDIKNWSRLMGEAQKGNKIAYERLLNEISPLILKLILKKIHRYEWALDIQQDVLLTIHKARHTFDPKRDFQPWLYSIVRHKVFDHFRKYKRVWIMETANLDFVEMQADEEDTLAEEKKLFQDALNQLSEKQREAVQLVKVDGLSLQEAADQLQISLSAMKVRAHRGYEELKKIINENQN